MALDILDSFIFIYFFFGGRGKKFIGGKGKNIFSYLNYHDIMS